VEWSFAICVGIDVKEIGYVREISFFWLNVEKNFKYNIKPKFLIIIEVYYHQCQKHYI